MNRSTVVIELAGDAGFSRDLAAGGVFVPGCALRIAEECDLVVRGATHELRVPARVVYVDDQRGAGLELIGFSSEMKAQLAELEPIAPTSLEFLEVPVDGSALDELPPPEDDAAFGRFSEPFPLTDLQALDDAGDDDLAVPLAGATAAFPIAAATRGEADAADAGDVDPDEAASAAATSYGPSARAYRRAAVYDAVVLGNLDEVDPRHPDYAYLSSAKTLPPDNVMRYSVTPYDQGGDPPGDDPDLHSGAEPGAAADAEPDAEPGAEPDAEVDGTLGGEADGTLGDEPSGELGVDHPASEIAGESREPGGAQRRAAPGIHQRLRGLTLASQVKLASSGEQHERIVLERLYGKNVWEALLRNPRLTPPEVARIARYGALPRVLLEIILGNNAWLQIAEVRRALLSNPRLGTDQVMKVLRLTPKHELKLAAIQTAYPHTVRHAAKLLLRGD